MKKKIHCSSFFDIANTKCFLIRSIIQSYRNGTVADLSLEEILNLSNRYSAVHNHHIDKIKEQDLRLVIVEIEVRSNERYEIDAGNDEIGKE